MKNPLMQNRIAAMRFSRRAFVKNLPPIVLAVEAMGARPQGSIIDTHVHLFAADIQKFPFAKNSPYQPAAAPIDRYLAFTREARIDHAVIVHPEPYQDDHSYLEYCFRNESPKGFFKGTCLFDPLSPETPARMEALVKRNPNRIVALRIHEVSKPGSPSTRSGPITGRDMNDPAMNRTWAKAHELGLAIQMHFLPHYAPAIEKLARSHPDMPVILDHLGRGGMETPQDFKGVLDLGRLPKTYMKISGLNYSSKQKSPFLDVKPLVLQAYKAFGPDRLLWGGLGQTMDEFNDAVRVFEAMFDGIPEGEKAKIRGGNAERLFGF